MAWAEELQEYVTNLKVLLSQNEARYGLMVERQVRAQLLRRMQGSRSSLEIPLWSLLCLCLNGHEAECQPLDDSTWEKARAAALESSSLAGNGKARFPAAALALSEAMDTLRTYGVFPRPKLAP